MLDERVRTDGYRQWIGGDAVAPGAVYEIVDPGTARPVGDAPDGTVADVADAVAAASAAFEGWSATPPAVRAELIGKAAEALRDSADELVPLVQAETGGVLQAARGANVIGGAARLDRFARGALEPTEFPFPPELVGRTGYAFGGPTGFVNAMTARRPVGVVACITAYNFPLTNMIGKIGPALAMGNTVVMKPAPQDPLQIVRLAEIFHQVGIPPGVLNCVVSRSAEVSKALVGDLRVDMVSFTGSTAVGRQIAETCGRNMTRVLMELGGKGACIVFDSADLDRALSDVASTFKVHAGQVCTAPTRLVAHRSVYGELTQRLAALAVELPIGDQRDPRTVVGPVITAAQRDRIEELVQSGVDEGGRILAGGTRPDLPGGFFAAPTLIGDVGPSARVAQHEVFGPVVVALPFDTEDEAVEIANGTEFGLSNYVHTADYEQALRVSARLRSGAVGINTVVRHMESAFGGFKASGIGRDSGSYALAAYSELQSLSWPS